MNLAAQRQKNWQWRIIVWSSLLLIFGKSLGHWCYHALAIDSAYNATTSIAAKAGITDILGTNQVTPPSFLMIQVRNDTPNEYTLETKVSTGHIEFSGNNFAAGEIKRFTIKPANPDQKELGTGDIIFLSAPMAGNNNTTCQEIHTLNYDLRDASQMKHPLVINLSSITSKLDCKENAITTGN